jgi:hypothetical protein
MFGFRQVVRILWLRCFDATELSSSLLDEPMEFPERLALYSHLATCRSCRRFHNQIRRIRSLLRSSGPNTGSTDPKMAGQGLSLESQLRIKKAIQDASRNRPDGPLS